MAVMMSVMSIAQPLLDPLVHNGSKKRSAARRAASRSRIAQPGPGALLPCTPPGPRGHESTHNITGTLLPDGVLSEQPGKGDETRQARRRYDAVRDKSTIEHPQVRPGHNLDLPNFAVALENIID
ncbi:unnamed protein product [Parajaminaea phylloscopi]